MINQTVQAIEENIRQAKTIVEVGEALSRLQSNRDFKTVILDGYFKQEAIRLVQLKAAPSMQSSDMQKAIITQIDAIGSLHQYFVAVFQQESIARKAIASDEETRDELLAEGDN